MLERTELSAQIVQTETPSMMDILIECERLGLSALQADWFIDGAVTARHKNHTHGPRVAVWAEKGRVWMLSQIQSRTEA